MKQPSLHSSLVVIAVVVGCSGERSSTNAVVTDSAGVLITTNPQAVWVLSDNWQIGPEPILDIGGVSTDSNYQFYRVVDSWRNPDGSIVVANSGTRELRFYDRGGQFLMSTGGEGGGPGEFEHLTWAQPYRGDSILTFDRRLVRLTVFDAEGQLGRTITPHAEDQAAITSAIGAFGDGTFLVVAETVDEDISPGIFRPLWTLFRTNANGQVGDSIGTYRGEESYLHVFRAGGAMDSPRLFSNTTMLALAGNQFFAGHTGEFDIRKHDATGELVSAFRRRHGPVNVSPEDVALIKEERLESVRHIEHLRERVSEFLDAMPLPAYLPAFGSIRVDDIGNLWVEEYLQPGTTIRRWTVFDTGGSVVAMVQGPDRFEPLHVGDDFLLGRWTDELGEEHVRVYRLSKEE